ncbi:hypothetical protein BU23DRAFT_64000 [Bimuria novae-zelandiae CBS 107.79]|uniref:Uncharacterized protein n=1 Tax=Bimuria novae-zelandiae CBS 107.79 TaxID=1447943 RepID=A0A6A5UHT8_9PLEO|nr:hypothetical protein BU23DRAFT_64000 [Bimuria novae-zelandiae CBS 107.79]
MDRQPKNAAGETGPSHPRAVNDAFGKSSPHWNLPFPAGRLTVAEILAYCPHWLKSVDVINRFVTNGAKSKIIAGMLNRFRIPPVVDIQTNSVCVMMQCAMRAAGYLGWTMGNHSDFSDFSDTSAEDWEAANLDVSCFRTPRVTHPKKGSKKIENVAAEPIEFRDLARDVKIHPSGSDALDLTRCVIYAIEHPEESWRFPDDFERLVNKLGGPQRLTHYHLDTQAFKRAVVEIFPPAERKKLSVTPVAKRVHFADTTTMVTTRKSDMRLATPKAVPMTTSKKRNCEEADAVDTRTPKPGDRRRSGRIATQGVKDLREPDTDAGTPDATPYYKNYNTYGPPQKKHKSHRASSDESEFIGSYTTDSETLPDAYDQVSDDILTPELESKRPVRVSAQKGRRLTQQAIFRETPKTSRSAKGATGFKPSLMLSAHATPANATPVHATPAHIAAPNNHVPLNLIDPVLLSLSHTWEERRRPILVTPLVLNPSRLVIDSHTIRLYAEENCPNVEDMWNSALSSTRFNGPRKHAPFRELYRLTDPMPWDSSDWAENIRWAKEQYRAFGVDSWTEYDDHLEQITQWRRQNMWVSEEAAKGGI